MSVENGSTMFSLPIHSGYTMSEIYADFAITELSPVITHVPSQESLKKSETEVVCRRYASDIWSGLERMSQTPTGYPEDMIRIEDGIEISNQRTSPTNIGIFLASSIAARDMQLVSPEETDRSIGTILTSLERAKKYQGMFYNWYDTQTGDAVEQADGALISTVDNAWLAVGLMTILASASDYSVRAEKIIEQMDFPLLYNGDRNLFYGGYYPDSQKPTNWHYDILNTEARIASYIGISTFNIPAINYSRLGRFAPADVEVPSQEIRQPFPSWGGSMFEALMPTLFVPEQNLSSVWEANHREYIKEQMQHGEQHDNGFWGYSPCYNGEYHEEGLDKLAILKGGYGASHIITPHALFLSLPFMSTEAVESLQQLERTYPNFYNEGIGFSDSVNVHTSDVAHSYLSLDQGMSLIALFNHLHGNKMHDYLPQLETIKPLITALNYDQLLVA